MHSTAELWHWIQEALGDTQTRTRLLEGEDLLELLRNGLPPGMRNAVRITPEAAPNTAGPPADTESEDVESSSEITEADNSSEAGTSEIPGLYIPSCVLAVCCVWFYPILHELEPFITTYTRSLLSFLVV